MHYTLLSRRLLLSGGASLAAGAAFAQNPHAHHQGQFERLNQPGRMGAPDLHFQHAVTESPAPKAAKQGKWRVLAPLPLPRTEMGAVVLGNEIVVAGGGPQMGGGVKSAINEAFALG